VELKLKIRRGEITNAEGGERASEPGKLMNEQIVVSQSGRAGFIIFWGKGEVEKYRVLVGEKGEGIRSKYGNFFFSGRDDL